MASDKLKSYPSGFLGAVDVPMTEPIDVAVRARNLLSVQVHKQVSHHSANQDVADLIAELLTHGGERLSFEFCTRVLKVAKRAFGTKYFTDWILTQGQSPDFSINHAKWIDETIQFIFMGKAREMSRNNWIALLRSNNSAERFEPPSELARHYIFRDGNTKYGPITHMHNRSMSVDNIIVEWVRQPGGITDLLYSLDVLFGRR